jgi:hypothetical protein
VAARVKPVLDWVSNVSPVPMVFLLAVANIDKILRVFGTRGIFAGTLLVALGLVTSGSFSDRSVVIMVFVVTIVGLLTLMPLCHVLANYGFKQSTK